MIKKAKMAVADALILIIQCEKYSLASTLAKKIIEVVIVVTTTIPKNRIRLENEIFDAVLNIQINLYYIGKAPSRIKPFHLLRISQGFFCRHSVMASV